MIYSAVAWCCSRKHDNHLISSVASLVLFFLFSFSLFFFKSLNFYSMSREIITAFVFLAFFNLRTNKMSSNQRMIIHPTATWFLNYFLKTHGKNMFIVLLFNFLSASSSPPLLLKDHGLTDNNVLTTHSCLFFFKQWLQTNRVHMVGLMGPHISNCRLAERVQYRAIILRPYSRTPHTLPDTIRMKGLS